MPRVILKGHITVPKDELTVIRQALPAHIEATRAEPGCIEFDVTESTRGDGVFDVFEIFESEEAFRNHQSRVKTSAWGKISQHVERHYTVEGLEA